MRLDLFVYDPDGKARGYAALQLDFAQQLWLVEEDSQHAWRKAGFARSGPFEVKDDDVVWIWEQEIGNARRNTLVLTDFPMTRLDADQTGNGRIVTGRIGKFHGGTVHWTVVEPMKPARPSATLEVLGARSAPAIPSELAA